MPERAPISRTIHLDRVVSGPPAFAVNADVRCPNCDKKLGERLVGTLEVTCPRCKRKVTITR